MLDLNQLSSRNFGHLWFNLVNFGIFFLEFRLSFLISINWVLTILLYLRDFALFRSTELLQFWKTLVPFGQFWEISLDFGSLCLILIKWVLVT